MKRGYVYILECMGKYLYVGQTSYPIDRLVDHYRGQGSVFTKARQPVKLVHMILTEDMTALESKLQGIRRMGIDFIKKYCPSNISALDIHEKVMSELEYRKQHRVPRIDPLAMIQTILGDAIGRKKVFLK